MVVPNYSQLKQDKKESYLRDFQRQCDRYITTHIRADFIHISLAKGLNDVRPYIWQDCEVQPEYDYVGSIDDETVAWERLDGDLRKSIRLAERKGVEVYEGTLEDFLYIIGSVEERLAEERSGGRRQRWAWQGSGKMFHTEYMSQIYRQFGLDSVTVLCARYEGRRVGGLMFTSHRDTASVWVGAVRSRIKGVPYNDLLHWRAMRLAQEKGMKLFEIQGANMPTTSKIKSRFGLDLAMRFNVKKLCNPVMKLASMIRRGLL